ncbi:MAG TPA: 4Fe-4S dicluster domain-containing protein [Thermoplasmata archaeon]|nr:4Fe-4S dicluster domain-containing protein [Thermoplasmata archaeon]
MGEVEKTFISGLHEKLVEDKIISEDELEPDFAKEIVKYGGKDVMTCLQCGNCTGVCPISLKIDYKTRSIIKYCQFGLKKFTLGTRWVCATCYRCYEHCPADINPAEVMIALRHIAIREGVIPPFIKVAATNLVKYGQSVKPDPEIEKIRKELELGDVPSRAAAYAKVIREINMLVHASGYDKLLGIEDEVKA